MNEDTCINCGTPHNDRYTLYLGMFKVCDKCEAVGQANKQALSQGIVIERIDPKTGVITKGTYY